MSGKMTTIQGPAGSFAGYLAAPASGRGPGVVVIQEIFGVNEGVRAICDGHAARGRFALAPDLFWRIEPGIDLTDKTDTEWKKALDLMNKFDVAEGVKDIQATISHLRRVEGCSGKVGAVGYCLGGLLAYLTAVRTDSDATVGYYGVNIPAFLSEGRNIKKPLMLHIAGKDQFVPPEQQQKVREGLSDHNLVTIHDYLNMDHAFARPGGQHYDKACAELANGRTETFFRQHLS